MRLDGTVYSGEIMIIQEQFQDLEMIHQNIGNKAVKCLRLSYMV